MGERGIRGGMERYGGCRAKGDRRERELKRRDIGMGETRERG